MRNMDLTKDVQRWLTLGWEPNIVRKCITICSSRYSTWHTFPELFGVLEMILFLKKQLYLYFHNEINHRGIFLTKPEKKVCHALLTYKLRVWRILMYVFCTVKTTNLFQKWRNFLLRKTRNSFYRNKKFLLPKNKKLPSTENKKFSFYQYEQVSWAIIEANMCQIPWPL